jgi:hypothetical protein
MPSDEYLSAPQAAALLPGHPHPTTLNNWTKRGDGPPGVRLGRRWLYKRSDVLA